MSLSRSIFLGVLIAMGLLVMAGMPLSASAQGNIDWNEVFDGTVPAKPKPTKPTITPEEKNSWADDKVGDGKNPDIDTNAQGYVECAHLPPSAFRYIGEPLNNWMQLTCPENGGVYIAPTTGYRWLMASKNDFFAAAEQSGGFLGRTKLPETGYFSKIGFERLTDQKRLSASALFASVVSNVSNGPEARKDENAFDDFWRMYLVNNSDQEMNLYVYFIDQEPKWLISCNADCKDYELVKVLSPKKNTGPAGMPSIMRR